MQSQKELQVDSETKFEGKIVNVRVDRVLLADGKTVAQREVVDHNPSVVIVPVDAEGNVMLVRQFRYPAGESLLEAPAGGVEEGESPDDCAQRELQEEIGFASRDLRVIGGFWTSPGFCTEFMYAYIAKDLVPSQGQQDADENIIIEKIPLSRTPRLIRLGEIQDAKTIAALMMANYLFENK